MIRHYSPISGVASFRDDLIATAGYDNQLILWDAKTSSPLARANHDHLANHCQFSPCGKFLASASSDYTARLWSVPELRLLSVLGNHTDDVDMAVFHPSAPLIATCSHDGKIRVFSFQGKLRFEFSGHCSYVNSVSWSADGGHLFSTGEDGQVLMWRLGVPEPVQKFSFEGIQTDTVCVDSTGKVFVGDDSGHISIFSGSRKIATVKAHRSGIKNLVLSPFSNQLAAASYDRTVSVWDIGATLTESSRHEIPWIIWPRSSTFLNAHTLLFGTFGSSYGALDLTTQKWNLDHVETTVGINHVREINGDVFATGDAGVLIKNGQTIQRVNSLCNFIAPLGDEILFGGQSGEVFSTKRTSPIFISASPINCAVPVWFGSHAGVILGAYSGDAILIERNSSRNAYDTHVFRWHENAIKGLAASEKWVFSVSADRSVALHHIGHLGREETRERGHSQIVNGCAWLKGDLFATISRDKTLVIWNGSKVERVFPSPHTHSIKCIASDDSGRFIITGSYSGTISIFDIETQDWIQTRKVSANGISSVCFDRKRARFLASDYGGEILEISTTV